MAKKKSPRSLQKQTAAEAKKSLALYARPDKAVFLKRFFKTGKGEYAEGDQFLGVAVPDTRKIARVFLNLRLFEVSKLLRSKIHEERLLSLIILTLKFKKATEAEQEEIYRFYMKHLKWINNWDLVDTSAPHIVGAFLENRSRRILYQMARSKNLWHRRVAIVSTQYFIRNRKFADTVSLARILLHDKHDLIHKAVGWMLREAGNRDPALLIKFLDRWASQMPRTMLRYSIERLNPRQRKTYMSF